MQKDTNCSDSHCQNKSLLPYFCLDKVFPMDTCVYTYTVASYIIESILLGNFGASSQMWCLPFIKNTFKFTNNNRCKILHIIEGTSFTQPFLFVKIFHQWGQFFGLCYVFLSELCAHDAITKNGLFLICFKKFIKAKYISWKKKLTIQKCIHKIWVPLLLSPAAKSFVCTLPTHTQVNF